jgi:signal peptidase I
MKDVTLAQQLEEEGFALTLSVGGSMKPMLRQRTEQIMLEKLTETPQKNDVVLFVRKGGKYVLHRVIRKEGERFLIRGDSCYDHELVEPEQIIGILRGFYRGEKYISCEESLGYRCYVFFWRLTYPVRWVYQKGKCLLFKVASRLRR